MRRFWEIAKNMSKYAIFGQNWPFLTKNWPKWPNFKFSSKIQKRHLFTFPETSVDAKNQKNLMREFLEKWGDERKKTENIKKKQVGPKMQKTRQKGYLFGKIEHIPYSRALLVIIWWYLILLLFSIIYSFDAKDNTKIFESFYACKSKRPPQRLPIPTNLLN